MLIQWKCMQSNIIAIFALMLYYSRRRLNFTLSVSCRCDIERSTWEVDFLIKMHQWRNTSEHITLVKVVWRHHVTCDLFVWHAMYLSKGVFGVIYLRWVESGTVKDIKLTKIIWTHCIIFRDQQDGVYSNIISNQYFLNN